MHLPEAVTDRGVRMFRREIPIMKERSNIMQGLEGKLLLLL